METKSWTAIPQLLSFFSLIDPYRASVMSHTISNQSGLSTHMSLHRMSPTASSNDSGLSSILEEFRERLVRVNDGPVLGLIALYAAVLAVGLVGNCAITYFTCRSRHPPHGLARNHVLLNLCAADLLVVVICCPMAIYTGATKVWLLGKPLCKVMAYLQGVTVTAGTMSMTALSLDRYIFVRHPTAFGKRRRRHVAAAMITLVWLLAALVSLPVLFVRTTKDLHIDPLHVTFCIEHWESDFMRRLFTVFTLILVYLVPCGVLVTCHASVSCTLCSTETSTFSRNTVRKRAFRIKAENSWDLPKVPPNTREPTRDSRLKSTAGIGSRSEYRASVDFCSDRDFSGGKPTCSSVDHNGHIRTQSSRARRRLANVLMGMTLCFVACWLPYNVTSLYVDLYPSHLLVHILPFTLLLGHAHSAINPVVYWLLNKSARRKLPSVVHFRSAMILAQSNSHHMPVMCLPFHMNRSSQSTTENALGAFHPRFTQRQPGLRL